MKRRYLKRCLHCGSKVHMAHTPWLAEVIRKTGIDPALVLILATQAKTIEHPDAEYFIEICEKPVQAKK